MVADYHREKMEWLHKLLKTLAAMEQKGYKDVKISSKNDRSSYLRMSHSNEMIESYEKQISQRC